MRLDALAPNALVLTSGSLFSTSIQRVVITSSTAAVRDVLSTPKRFSEADWNTTAAKEVEALGSGSSAAAIYMASKTLAEQGGLDFISPRA